MIVGECQKRKHKVNVNLGSIERIPIGEGREFEVNGELIAVFRTRGGDVFAAQAKCPHREGPLSSGIVGGGKVICPLHGFKFDLANGQAIANQCESLKTFQVCLTEANEILLSVQDRMDFGVREPCSRF